VSIPHRHLSSHEADVRTQKCWYSNRR